MTDAERQLDGLLAAVQDPGQPTNSYWDVQEFVAGLLGRPSDDVYPASVSKPGNFSVRADQSPRSRAAKIFIAVLASGSHVEATVKAMSTRIGPGRLEGGLVVAPAGRGHWSVAVVHPPGSGLVQQIQQHLPSAGDVEVQPRYTSNGSTTGTTPPPVPRLPHVTVPLVLDPRVKRMLRLSIASAKAVMIVGPPGTGKTTLLDEAFQEITADPGSYGLSTVPDGIRQVTPEESWTTRDLLGGETVDDQGRLRFRPGFVLEAIRDNAWLFLDEANRADMDKIFGGLLTWLSHKPVVVGRAAPGLDAPPVRLEWGSDASCSVVGYDRLESGAGGTPIRFVAGTDWRLVGTFNALDAQRVFRFGQALGRRFARVPLPPIDADDFEEALQPHLDDLSPDVDRADVTRVVRGLYAAHLDAQPPLGPALFLAIPGYVARGLGLLEVAELAEPDAATQPSVDDATRLRLAVSALVAEAYLLGAGTWLAQLEPDELASHRRRVVDEEDLLSESQWTFIQQMLPSLA